MNKLNPHSSLASFYRYFYITHKLPNNLCNYFWGLIFAFVSLPFVWTAVFINRFNNKIQLKTRTYLYDSKPKTERYYDVSYENTKTAVGLAYTLLAFFIGIIVLGSISKIWGVNPDTLLFGLKAWLAVAYLYSVGIASCFIAVGLFFIVMALIRLIPSKPQETEEEYYAKRRAENKKDFERMERRRKNPSFLTLTWRWLVAFKEKNCPLIEWEYEKTDESTKS